jgi:hypothetical protein
LIFLNSFQDAELCETVSKTSRADILALVVQPTDVTDVPDIEKGEVLVDSRGRGSFQQVNSVVRRIAQLA